MRLSSHDATHLYRRARPRRTAATIGHGSPRPDHEDLRAADYTADPPLSSPESAVCANCHQIVTNCSLRPVIVTAAAQPIDGVDVSGLSFALFLDTPPVMSEGNWRVGVYLDDAASDRQAEQLGMVLSGQAGGPPAMLGPLIGEMLGVEKARITYSEDGRGHHVRIGEAVDIGVEDFVAIEGHDPVQLTNVFHPSNTTLTVAPANAAHLSTFGIDWGREGQSGFSAPFSWSG
jgi:hypothetical protein